jgi:hypothetical protein
MIVFKDTHDTVDISKNGKKSQKKNFNSGMNLWN